MLHGPNIPKRQCTLHSSIGLYSFPPKNIQIVLTKPKLLKQIMAWDPSESPLGYVIPCHRQIHVLCRFIFILYHLCSYHNESKVRFCIPRGSSPVVRVTSSDISLLKSVRQVCVNAVNFCLFEFAQVKFNQTCLCVVYGSNISLCCCGELHHVGRICPVASGGLRGLKRAN